jgi:hypothetical protein
VYGIQVRQKGKENPTLFGTDQIPEKWSGGKKWNSLDLQGKDIREISVKAARQIWWESICFKDSEKKTITDFVACTCNGPITT